MNNKRKLNPKIIRIGDLVKVINPEIVIRVGYPLSFDDMLIDINKQYKKEVNNFINEIYKNYVDNPRLFPLEGYIRERIEKKLYGALTYMLLHIKRFGGKERKIYTEIKEEFRNKQYSVINVRFIKTGNYYPASGGGYFHGEYDDYEPAYLDGMETHKILTTNQFEIEARNVKKVNTNGNK